MVDPPGRVVAEEAVGQNAEYIRHNETGILVPAGDAAAMAGLSLTPEYA